MKKISKSRELLLFLQDEYINNGYMYSGSWPYNGLLDKGFKQEAIDELLSNGLVQRRNREGLAYELSVSKRHQLLSQHSLCSRWLEKAGNALLEDIRVEIQSVSLVNPCINNADLFTVDTLKVQGDDKKPDKMDVSCPFWVGQVIRVEYDLPKQRVYGGYSSLYDFPGGVAMGEFMVTDVMCNLLVDPPKNMIELQSLSPEFNRIHPNDRTMLLFENVVVERTKESCNSIDDKIRYAKEKSDKQRFSSLTKNHNLTEQNKNKSRD